MHMGRHFVCMYAHQKRAPDTLVLELLVAGGRVVMNCVSWYFFCFVFFVCLFRDRVSLCSPGCPGTHSVDQAGLELRNLLLPSKCWD